MGLQQCCSVRVVDFALAVYRTLDPVRDGRSNK